jgi:hypothetical protein
MHTSKIVSVLVAAACFGFANAHVVQKHKHRISPAAAAKIALAKYPGKLLKKPVLEHEDGAWQYEVLVRSHGKMKEINVNAASGHISSVENTSPKEEKREAGEKGGE